MVKALSDNVGLANCIQAGLQSVFRLLPVFLQSVHQFVTDLDLAEIESGVASISLISACVTSDGT